MLKLKKVTFAETPKIPGLRPGAVNEVNVDEPHPSLRGWRFLIRGAAVFLISPPGWKVGSNAPHEPEAGATCTMFEIPRIKCFLHWDGDDVDVEKVAKYTSDPFGGPWPPKTEDKPASLLAQLPADQMGDA